jgi:hypothetical protein
MKRLVLSVVFIIIFFPGFSQTDKELPGYFEKAYARYPNVPYPLLEAMAYAGSHLQPLVPLHEPDDHGQPARYGLFALVEDGKGYFAQTIPDICKMHGITVSDFKNNTALQVMAVAHYVSEFCKQYQAENLRSIKPVLQAFCEIPATGAINAFARDACAY